MILDLKSPPTGRHDLGRWGERLIGAWYERNQRGVVIGTNVRLGSLELDVIVRDGALVRVVEVRTSARRPTHELSWSVVGKKMSRVRRAMERLVRCKDYHVDQITLSSMWLWSMLTGSQEERTSRSGLMPCPERFEAPLVPIRSCAMTDSLFDDHDEPTSAKKDAPQFEAVLEELEKIVQKLETEQPSLEESLTLFERGMKLANEGNRVLESAQARVEKIVAVNEDGTVQTEPLPPMD